MSRFIFALFLTAAVLGAFAASASACINDRESSRSEREFKSHYGDPPPATPAPEPPYQTPEGHFLAFGGSSVGAALLLGAVSVTFWPRRRV